MDGYTAAVFVNLVDGELDHAFYYVGTEWAASIWSDDSILTVLGRFLGPLSRGPAL
jgi:hypothetical protein